MAGRRLLKFIFCFMKETHEPLHLEKLKFGIVNDYGHTTCFI
jgi:hypothetical protein